MGKKKRNNDANTDTNTPYDDVFRTLLNDCQELIIPIINLAFGEHFTGDERIAFYPNELFIKQQGGSSEKRITDTYFTIYGYKEQCYHFECASTVDNTILIRLAEYDLQIAMQMREIEGDTLHLTVPKSAVLYLRHNENTPDYYKVVLHSTADESLTYTVPVIKTQNITIEEIFEKKLYFLIPFYIFSFESRFFEYENDEEKLEALKQEFLGIRVNLEELEEKGELDAYKKYIILDMSNKVIVNLARKTERLKKEVGKTMVGPTIDHTARRILQRGIEQGYSQGMTQGISQGMTMIIEKSLMKGNSVEAVAEFNDIPLEEVLKVKESMDNCKSG